MVSLSADQQHSELRQDHLDEQLNDIADYQRYIDGTVWSPINRMTYTKYGVY